MAKKPKPYPETHEEGKPHMEEPGEKPHMQEPGKKKKPSKKGK
jgi:hypothetical protein